MDLVPQWRVCATLRAFEQLTALGWSLSASQFRRYGGALGLLGLISLAGLSAFVCDVIRGTLITRGAVDGLPMRLTLLYLAGNGYLLCLGVCRQVLTARRDLIAHPANVDFYRAMDLNAAVVFTVWAMGPILRQTAALCVVAAAFVRRSTPN